MSIYRNTQIYVTARTKSRLKLIAELFPARSQDTGSNDTRYASMSHDEVADHLLNQVIEREFPAVLEMENELEAVKKRYRTEAKQKISENAS